MNKPQAPAHKALENARYAGSRILLAAKPWMPRWSCTPSAPDLNGKGRFQQGRPGRQAHLHHVRPTRPSGSDGGGLRNTNGRAGQEQPVPKFAHVKVPPWGWVVAWGQMSMTCASPSLASLGRTTVIIGLAGL